MTPGKDRAQSVAQRQANLRQRRIEQGLVRLELWVHPTEAPKIKALADKLAAQRGKPTGSHLPACCKRNEVAVHSTPARCGVPA